MVKRFKRHLYVPKKVIVSIYDELFELAKEENDFTSLIFHEIKSIIKKTKVRPTLDNKRSFCNKCGSLFEKAPRIKNKSLVLICTKCGHVNRKKLV